MGFFVFLFLSRIKNVSKCIVTISLGKPAGQLSVCGKNFNVVIFSDTVNMMSNFAW